MDNYLKLEQKVIESMKAKGHQTPYQTRRSSLRIQSLLTGLASIVMLLTYGFLKFGSNQQSPEMWSLPFFILLLGVTFTSRKRMQAVNQLKKEQSVNTPVE